MRMLTRLSVPGMETAKEERKAPVLSNPVQENVMTGMQGKGLVELTNAGAFGILNRVFSRSEYISFVYAYV